jgi:hypothetical protein
MGFKSEALEPSYHWTEAYCHMECPYCKVHNVVSLGNLDDITSIDVEACLCHGCSKKFWLPGSKDIHETDHDLKPGEDLIETAECQEGRLNE